MTKQGLFQGCKAGSVLENQSTYSTILTRLEKKNPWLYKPMQKSYLTKFNSFTIKDKNSQKTNYRGKLDKEYLKNLQLTLYLMLP